MNDNKKKKTLNKKHIDPQNKQQNIISTKY